MYCKCLFKSLICG